jgi:hypothetical protein
MNIAKAKNLKFLTTISSVLIAFLLLRSYQLVYSVFTGSESSYITMVRGIAILPYFGLSYLTLKRNMIAAWGMVIVLGLAGASSLVFGIVTGPTSQYIIKIFSIIFGVYFAYGCCILYKSIRDGEMNQLKSKKKKA